LGTRKKRSIFNNFVRDGIGFFEEAQAAYDRLQNKAEEVKDVRSLEEKKMFSIARAYEAFSKALLSTYGTIILIPVAIFSVNSNANLRFPRHLQRIENSFRELIRQGTSPKVIKKKLGHDPVGGSKIVELLRASSELLNELGQTELKKLFDDINRFIEKPPKDRNYKELQDLRKKITVSFTLRELSNEVTSLLEECLLSYPEESAEYCQALSEKDKKVLKILLDKPYLLDQILSIMDLGVYELLDTLLYTAYLAHAASGIAAYSEGREDVDEKYLEELRDHQKEMLDNLKHVSDALYEIAYNDEFDEVLADIEEKARSLLKTDQDEEK